MNNFLVLVLSLTAILAIYWVLMGQWKHNAMLRQHSRKIKAVLFDLDGVLIDSHDAWLKVFNYTRKRLKLPEITAEEFDKNVWGGSIEKDARGYFKNIEAEEIAKIYYGKLSKFKKDVKINPYVHYTLKNIKDKKLRVGVVTNNYKKPTLRVLEFYGIKNFFDVIVGGDEVEKGKPAPDAIFKACENLKIKPEEALYIGDTKNDINAGRNAGCFTIGYKIHGDLMIGDIKDILKLF